MRKQRGFTIVKANCPPPPPDRFNVETLGTRPGRGWIPVVGVPDDKPETVRRMLRAQGWQDSIIDKREWRVVPI